MATSVSTPVREISVAHSPDSDDAFMFYALATNKLRTPGLTFTHKLCDIETLNRQALDGVYDVTAISFHAYPYIQEKYALLPSGGSVGEGYGPMVVSRRALELKDLQDEVIAVPGALTDSIQYALDHREDALAYAMQFARDLDRGLANQFVGMYVNQRTLDYGDDGRQAVRRLLDMGYKAGVIPNRPRVEFVE